MLFTRLSLCYNCIHNHTYLVARDRGIRVSFKHGDNERRIIMTDAPAATKKQTSRANPRLSAP